MKKFQVKGWEHLKYFSSGEWQVVDERLGDLEKTNRKVARDGYNPGRARLFAALKSTSFEKTRCCIVGQDPYPTAEHATGIAFSIPSEIERDFPPTLRCLFDEYTSDLHYPYPSKGDLSPWTGGNGVLLWNAIPSCRTGASLSHDWEEWSYLTHEIIRTLSEKGVVFALLGQVARRYLNDIDLTRSDVLLTSHPSPRGSRASHTPFLGSRLFSTINDKLTDMGQRSIDWRLP